MLPREIVVLQAEEVPAGFSARHDATSRTYRYRILARRQPSAFERGRALWWPHRLDEDALHACAALLPGTHDFTAFTPTQTYHQRFERTVHRAGWTREGDVLTFEIEAKSFMRNMNRILVGTMLEVAQGRRDDFASLLEGAPRSAAGDTAAPHGLYLTAVSYEDRACRASFRRAERLSLPPTLGGGERAVGVVHELLRAGARSPSRR